MVVTSDGAIYFSDPFWGGGFANPYGPRVRPEDQELSFNGVFRVSPDGTVGPVAELAGPEPGVPDGMKVDVEGNVYCTGAGGVWIVAPSGEILGRIAPPEIPANVAWGDADWRALYITARTSVYRVRLSIPGLAVP